MNQQKIQLSPSKVRVISIVQHHRYSPNSSAQLSSARQRGASDQPAEAKTQEDGRSGRGGSDRHFDNESEDIDILR